MSKVYRVNAKKPTRIGAVLASKYYISEEDLPEFRTRLVYSIEAWRGLVGAIGLSLLDQPYGAVGYVIIPLKVATLPSTGTVARAELNIDSYVDTVSPTLYVNGRQVTDMCATCHTRLSLKIADKTKCPNYTTTLTLGCLLMGLSKPVQADPSESEEQDLNPTFFLDRSGEVRILMAKEGQENAAV